MPLPLNEIKKLIKESIPDAKIEIRDLMGDNNHYSAKIQSKNEILADNDYLPVKKRVEVISKLIERKKSKVVYSYCINADPIQLIDNLANVSGGGGDCVHINFWSGLGAYTASNSLGLITHYQRLLDYIKPDIVHIMSDGKIIKSGDADLALYVEKNGYSEILNEKS